MKDIDFAQSQIVVRDGKGGNSRITMLSLSLCDRLKDYIHSTRLQHQQDLAKGFTGLLMLPQGDR
ncbi:MAG: hypothetical protein MH252_07290 [Thermosynechococcaceae cyanobacterium MS004]|nr:hypothetical protein [Thermosynechococcaceae cyanobacterium MS004]